MATPESSFEDLEDNPARKRRDLAPPTSRHILGMRVDATDYAGAMARITSLAHNREGGYVCVATVHMVMEAFDNATLRAQINAADLVTSDGMPLVWGLRALGLDYATRVYGPTLTPLLCHEAARQGLRVGFIGGSSETLQSLVTTLEREIPALEIAFQHAPPFRPLRAEEDQALVESIRDAEVDVLFVGLGCPKQERFMAEHRESLSCVCVGVGAAFDFIAGNKLQAPAWLQRAGLEWLFRLFTEPRRLWRRYLYHNPRFLWAFALQLLHERSPRPHGV